MNNGQHNFTKVLSQNVYFRKKSRKFFAMKVWSYTVHDSCTTASSATYGTDVLHFVASQNTHMIPTGIHCKQFWNVIIISVIIYCVFGFVMYFWI